MVIAVYADVSSFQPGDAYEYFIKNLLLHLAKLHPKDEFYFIYHSAIDEFEQTANLHLVCLPAKNNIASRYFLNRKIVSVIKKVKAEKLISIDRIISTKLQQKLIVTKLNAKAKFKAAAFQKLNAVFTLSQSLKTALIKYQLAADKINVVYGAPTLREPVSDETKTALKERFTEGKEYFLFRGRIANDQNILTLLKAFSVFKKRQKSSMKLVLTGKVDEAGSELTKLLTTYKFRDDVVLANENEKLLSAAAFAFIQPYSSNSISFVFDALQNSIPVLIGKDAPLAEIAPDAALYFDASTVEDIADKLMLIYKDENLYQRLKQKGNEIASAYSWQQTVQLF